MVSGAISYTESLLSVSTDFVTNAVIEDVLSKYCLDLSDVTDGYSCRAAL